MKKDCTLTWVIDTLHWKTCAHMIVLLCAFHRKSLTFSYCRDSSEVCDPFLIHTTWRKNKILLFSETPNLKLLYIIPLWRCFTNRCAKSDLPSLQTEWLWKMQCRKRRGKGGLCWSVFLWTAQNKCMPKFCILLSRTIQKCT